MHEISATDAARRFADILDAVEHRGEHFTIVRRGRAIAQLGPSAHGRGSEVKAVLRQHAPDPDWREDLESVRSLLEVDVRR
jgi:prevent-host-death family protein